MKNVEVMMTAIVALETRALAAVLKDFAVRERHDSTDFLLHLMEFDNRRGWVDFDCRSLWEFCTSELGLLDCATSQRVRAVKILRGFPQVEAYLRDGRLSVTSVVPLLKVLTNENATRLFERCSRLSRKQVDKVVDEILAELHPVMGPKTLIRALPEKTVVLEAPPIPPTPTLEIVTAIPGHVEPAAPMPAPVIAEELVLTAPVARRLSITTKQVSAREYAMHATVDRDFVDLLEEAKELYSHTFPSGDPVEVMRRALQIAIAEKLKKKAGKTESPRSSRADPGETITAETKRIVWERDSGCCAWKYADGRVCGSRWMIEYDHIVPPKHGGSSRPENVRLACDDHNQQHARDVYGDAYIERKKRERKRTKE